MGRKKAAQKNDGEGDPKASGSADGSGGATGGEAGETFEEGTALSQNVLSLLSAPGGLAILKKRFPDNWQSFVQQASQMRLALSHYEGNRLHVEVQELRDHFGLDEGQVRELDYLLKLRKETFDDDIYGLWDNLRNAYNPGGMMSKLLRDMQEGRFVGKVKPDGQLQQLVKKFKLDDQAASKLAQIFSEKGGGQKDALLAQLDRHLEFSNKPSSRVMMLLKKLRDGDPLGEPSGRPAPGSYLDVIQQQQAQKAQEEKDRARGGGRQNRSGSRGSPKRQRWTSRERGGGGAGHRRSRSRSRGGPRRGADRRGGGHCRSRSRGGRGRD